MSIFRRNQENDHSSSDAPAAPAAEPATGSTWIGEHTHLEGKIVARDDICIQGHLTGVVESEAAVVVPQGGRVEADITARQVAIHGEVVGNIETVEQAELGATGSLSGEIYAGSVVVRPGAVFEGSVRRRTRESSEFPEAQ